MAQDIKQFASNDNYLPWLDGLRGIAALWVMLSHVQILCGMASVPILSQGDLAVDLFMLLSGFLMAHNYLLRRTREPWENPNTFKVFWIRRYFRIAPLYYVLLFVALVSGPMLGHFRDNIAVYWPHTQTVASRYLDHSFTNVVSHVTFLFGFFPSQSFNTPLPDWSIGLEMQFYMAFPFIMLAMARYGKLTITALCIALCICLKLVLRDYFHFFEMPTFLPMKLYVFLAGMWIALARTMPSMRPGFFVGMALALLWLLIERSATASGRVLMVAGMFYLMDNGTLPGSYLLSGAVHRIRIVLSNSVSRFLGDSSYAMYMLHLLIVIPVAGWLASLPIYRALGDWARFLAVLAIAAPLVGVLSWLLFQYVEKFGIYIGKQVIRRMDSQAAKSPARNTVTEAGVD